MTGKPEKQKPQLRPGCVPAPKRSNILPAWLFDHMARQGFWDMSKWTRRLT
jgi:hypothetical protein